MKTIQIAKEVINMIMELVECDRDDAVIILDTISNSSIIQNAVKQAIKKEYEVQ